MSAKASYFKIGLFVITAVGIAIMAVIILGAGALLRKELLCETYIDQSVQGLDVGSAVKFRGVKIGNVKEIKFVASEYLSELDPLGEAASHYNSLILVRIALQPETFRYEAEEDIHHALQVLVSRGLRFRLAPAGVTGMAFLEADYLDPEKNPALEIPWEPRYPYVASAPSTITRFTNYVDQILTQMQGVDLEGISDGLKETLSAVSKAVEGADIEGVSDEAVHLLAEVRKTNQHLGELIEKGQIKSILTDASATMAALRRTVEGSEKPLGEVFADLPETSASMKSLIEKLDSTSDDLPETLTRLKRIVRNLDELISSQRPNVQRTLENMRAISQNVRDLSETAKKDPSSVFFGGPPPKSKRSKP